MLCDETDTAETKKEVVRTFECTLNKAKTEPCIGQALSRLVRQALNIPTECPLAEHQAPKAVQAQLQIGLLLLMLGFVAKDWRQAQAQAFSVTAQQRSANTWLRQIIEGLWDIFSTMWNQRSAIHHSKAGSDCETFDDDALNLKIRCLWDQGKLTLLPDDQTIFLGSRFQLLDKPCVL